MHTGHIYNLTSFHYGISEKMQSILQEIPPIQKEIKNSIRKLETARPHKHRHLVFEEDVYLENAKISSLSVSSVNGKKPFDPEVYLMTETSKNKQTLQDVKVNTLNVDWLLVDDIGNKSVGGK